MATISTFLQNPNPRKPQLSCYTSSIQRNQLSYSLIGCSQPSIAAKRAKISRDRGINRRSGSVFQVSASTQTFDVVVVGAGIIGLSIARQFLLNSDLSVAVVDASLPCSGATGAGQGYIWMAHKIPGSETWNLAMRSQQLWQMLTDNMQDEGVDPLDELGWKKTGSLLVGQNSKQSDVLKKRVEQLSAAGVHAKYLSCHDLKREEPELAVGSEGCAAFLPNDAQLDANRTVAFIQKGNRHFVSQGRYAEFFHDPAVCFISSCGKMKVEGVKTKNNTLYSKKAVVVAAGCWTGSLMHDLIGNTDVVNIPVQPRKGCLLVVENFASLKLKHGLMEAGYIDHLAMSSQSNSSAPKVVHHQHDLSISMTAAIDAYGNLLLGSSRQFAGFNTKLDMGVVGAIWERAGEFFPTLREFSLGGLSEKRKIRIGLRPYMPDGRPVISPIPQIPNVYLAAGHEGSGLSMALGTAEMVVDMGYIWMAHKTPGSETWDLVKRSHQLWQQLSNNILDEGSDPLEELGWKKTGSLLVGRNSKDSAALKKRIEQLSAAGLHAEYLSSSELQHKEPELRVGLDGCAAFLPDDFQIDARRTVTFIQKVNRAFALKGRYAEFFCDPAVHIIRSHVTGKIEGVKTKKKTVYGKKAVIVAAGCWTGSLMKELIQDSDVLVNVPVQPRKGVLLVVENNLLTLNHALLEFGYIDHLILPSQHSTSDHPQVVDHASISMGVTVDANGNLLIGSSREFAGFNAEISMDVVNRIWERAGEFFPALKQLSLNDFDEKWKARVGLRPYNLQCLMESQLSVPCLKCQIYTLQPGMKAEEFPWLLAQQRWWWTWSWTILQKLILRLFLLKEDASEF